MEYWQVKVQNEFENDKGRIQRTTELFLVVAVSASDAEAKIHSHHNGISNFRVTDVKKTKFLEVIE
tara:strand:- start:94 stop:291 length:198 start_codon:yes stop_codon:yes gene_type:complete